MVYFIQDTYSKAFKIGVSKDPGGRIVELQTGSPYELKLLYVIYSSNRDIDLRLERLCHHKFDEWRTRRGAEWFQVTDRSIRVVIKEIQERDSSLRIMRGVDYVRACKEGFSFGDEQSITVRHRLKLDYLNGKLKGTEAKIAEAFRGLQDGQHMISYAKIAEVSGVGKDTVVSFMRLSGLIAELLDYNQKCMG